MMELVLIGGSTIGKYSIQLDNNNNNNGSMKWKDIKRMAIKELLKITEENVEDVKIIVKGMIVSDDERIDKLLDPEFKSNNIGKTTIKGKIIFGPTFKIQKVSTEDDNNEEEHHHPLVVTEKQRQQQEEGRGKESVPSDLGIIEKKIGCYFIEGKHGSSHGPIYVNDAPIGCTWGDIRKLIAKKFPDDTKKHEKYIRLVYKGRIIDEKNDKEKVKGCSDGTTMKIKILLTEKAHDEEEGKEIVEDSIKELEILRKSLEVVLHQANHHLIDHDEYAIKLQDYLEQIDGLERGISRTPIPHAVTKDKENLLQMLHTLKMQILQLCEKPSVPT